MMATKRKLLKLKEPFVADFYCPGLSEYRPRVNTSETRFAIRVSEETLLDGGSVIRSSILIPCYGVNLDESPRYLNRGGGGRGLGEMFYLMGGIAVLRGGNPYITLIHEDFMGLKKLVASLGFPDIPASRQPSCTTSEVSSIGAGSNNPERKKAVLVDSVPRRPRSWAAGIEGSSP